MELAEFCNKYKIDPFKKCKKCGKDNIPKEWRVTDSDYAMVEFESCCGISSCIGVPLTQESTDLWKAAMEIVNENCAPGEFMYIGEKPEEN